MPPTLEGRVFTRLQRFAGLPADLQDDTKQFQAHVEQAKQKLFQTHHSALVKSVYSVRGKALIDAVVEWLQTRDATPAQATQPTAAAAETGAEETVTASADAAAGTLAPASTGAVAATVPVSGEVRERARQISEALVLAGFLTPYKDDVKHLNAPPPEYYVRDTDLLVPIAKSVTDLKTTSVWSVANGAVYAGFLKRRAGVLAAFTNGKEVYVVVNDTSQTAYLFESDLARAPIAEFVGGNVSVQFDNSHFEFGVRVTPKTADEKESKPELFNASNAHAQNEFLNVWLNIGADYHEAFNKHVEDVASIYELKDRDIDGNDIAFDRYKGKVLLVVNVSSKCGLTPTNYPELAELDRKYRDQGLEILAFPCNQFASQEPGTNAEIVEFVKQYDAHYTFFEKGDVNGAHARPVFTYLKAKLPGSFGNFVKWNFTKFLVDRNGQPHKRYSPQELPLSFEDEIVKLLNTPATVDEPPTTAADATAEPAVAPASTTTAAAPIGAAPASTSEPDAATTTAPKSMPTSEPAAATAQVA